MATVRCIRTEINVLKTAKKHPFLIGLYAFYQTLRKYWIIHRDIKPESILLDRKSHVKLGNFAYCKEGIAKGDKVNGFYGTIPYMAPEIMRNEYYDFSVDWYSFGVVLYELLIGPVYLLGSDEATSRYYQTILLGPWSVSVEATSILNGFLNMNPEERLGGKTRRKSRKWF
ncbi:atypical protein kinase C-like [Gordionus sp. m RMFG-2023]|uniref:atypical protein kinase C-like n=1 Tax=Gordionus sp. m RMFG-2023 TaxID=3053472 RepID=UPI0031FD9414